MARYHAVWILEDGRRLVVVPRTGKRGTFATIPAALRALERKGRTYPVNTHGVVKQGEAEVLHISL